LNAHSLLPLIFIGTEGGIEPPAQLTRWPMA